MVAMAFEVILVQTKIVLSRLFMNQKSIKSDKEDGLNSTQNTIDVDHRI